VLKTCTALIFLVAAPAHSESQGNQLTNLPKGVITVDGRDAPPLALANMDGETYDLAQSKGKWVFVHFWASWCGPCRKEMPTIQAIVDQFADSDLHIVLVNTAEDEDTVFNFLGIVAPDMDSLLDSDGSVTEAWQPRGLPSTYFVDPQGKLRYVALGGRPWDEGEYLGFLKMLIAK
jgi:thiol-disulfide isomerase/thioredoxin